MADRRQARALPWDEVLADMNKGVLEAYLLANVHVLRLCKAGLPIPPLNSTFFNQCLSLVMEMSGARGPKNDELLLSRDVYNSFRDPTVPRASRQFINRGWVHNAANQMATMAQNAVSLNFYRRAQIPRTATGAPKTTAHLLVPLTYRFLQDIEERNRISQGDPEFRQVRTFTVLPTKRGFECSHMKMCKLGLRSLLQRAGIRVPPEGPKWNAVERTYWRRLFNIKKFETANRKFAGQIVTDGKAVSIVMRKPKRETDSEQARVISMSEFDVMWGLDPGRRDLFVATNQLDETVSCSTKEFYEEARYTKAKQKIKGWQDRSPRVLEAIRNMPTKKSASLETLGYYIRFMTKRMDLLLGFARHKPFRRLRLRSFIFMKKKLRQLCLMLAREGDRTVVGFGDWSNQDVAGIIKKSPAGPVKRFERELARYCTVISIAEFRTSKVHFDCERELKNQYSQRLHGHAWQLDCGKAALSRGSRDCDALRDFRAFLLHHTADGHLSRQEAVSMVPALLLDVQTHHRVLDLCAAPGSKTAQIMEALLGSSGHSDGFVVANDANEKRGYLLVHQLQRLGLDNFVVTCHEGQNFPGLHDINGHLQSCNVFDRVLCDVPCSGDGTIRKNRNLWGRWAPGSALTLHQTQLELALRAAALLNDSGEALMTYSTCSLNPVENEAVVAELLRRSDGALELVDCSEMLPGLITRPGITSSALQWFDRYETVPGFLQGSRILRSMFPPASDTQRHVLTRCLRLFPTDQNTGGFFVALLRKVRGAKLPGQTQQGLDSYEVAATRSGERKPSRRALKQADESSEASQTAQEKPAKPVKMVTQTYMALQPDHWTQIQAFYGILDSFPQVRICEMDVVKGMRALQLTCSGTGGKLVFRPTEEGLDRLLPFITKRKAPATSEDFVAIVTVPGNDSKQVALGLERVSIELQEAAAAIREQSGVGPMLMVLETRGGETLQLPTALPVWLGDKTLTLLVDKASRERLAHTARE
ncbi:hypothetical protein BBJ28_00014403 [Nothophytophthora sp. Chile5]|nr:hypothetical protein BBJ28_00014403 [Nothophytophthora sp. Chile5]